MSDPVHQLYQGLLADPSLDAALQRRILSYARRAAWPLLIALCAHPNLDPGIDRELKAVRVASVRAAWLTRPGRPVPAVVAALGDDRRIVVCTAAASVAARESLGADPLPARCGYHLGRPGGGLSGGVA